MVDLDFVTSWLVEQIVRIIELGGDWDAISANGVYVNGDYYDRYALRLYMRLWRCVAMGNYSSTRR